MIETPHFIGKTNVCGRGIKEQRVYLRGLTEVDRSDRIDIICQFNAKKNDWSVKSSQFFDNSSLRWLIRRYRVRRLICSSSAIRFFPSRV